METLKKLDNCGEGIIINKPSPNDEFVIIDFSAEAGYCGGSSTFNKKELLDFLTNL